MSQTMKNPQNASRAQVSVEYMIVFGLALLLLIPTVYLFYNSTSKTNISYTASSVAGWGSQVANSVEYIASFSNGSKKTVSFTMPSFVSGVAQTPIFGSGEDTAYEFYVNVSAQGTFSVVFFTTAPFRFGNCTHAFLPGAGFIDPGKKSLRVESCSTFVSIYEVN